MPGELFRRRNLPHRDVPGATYFVTSCLAGSIPAAGFADLARYRKQLSELPRPDDQKEDNWEARNHKLLFARFDQWLDQHPVVRYLTDPALAAIVQGALLHFAETRCDVFAFVLMPSHFHWVFRPSNEYVRQLGDAKPRERLMQSVKTFSARECNKRLGRTGAFWQDESYDHWIRDLQELERVIRYVENNPVMAGLCERPEDWLWSSAEWRVERGIAWERPLPKP